MKIIEFESVPFEKKRGSSKNVRFENDSFKTNVSK